VLFLVCSAGEVFPQNEPDQNAGDKGSAAHHARSYSSGIGVEREVNSPGEESCSTPFMSRTCKRILREGFDTLVWLQYFPHWKETADSCSKLGVFCTGPAIRSVAANLISEIIGTFILVLVSAAVLPKTVSMAARLSVLDPTWQGVWCGQSVYHSVAAEAVPSIQSSIWASYRSRGSSHWRKGALGLEPCNDPGGWPSVGAGLAGLLVHALNF
jgi:hypothetical protein